MAPDQRRPAGFLWALLRRLSSMLFVVWGAASLTFLLFFGLPGDPVEAVFGAAPASVEAHEARRAALGLDRPLGAQYAAYWAGLLQGEAGRSWISGQPVGQLIAGQMPATLSLATTSGLGALCLGLILGTLPSLIRQPAAAQVMRISTLLAVASPAIVIGVLLLYLRAVTSSPAWGLMLAAASAAVSVGGGLGRLLDGTLAEALQAPHVLALQARGLTWPRIVLQHGLRQAAPTVLDNFGLQIGFLLGGLIVTEAIFSRQGLGRLALSAVLTYDLPVLQGLALLSAAVYGLITFGSDVLRMALHPA